MNSVPTSGLLCVGRCIDLCWPEPEEFDAITRLRNTARVRTWAMDNSLLDFEGNRHWLAAGMQRPTEAVLAVHARASGTLIGMIGWTQWDHELRDALFGRLAIDVRHAMGLRHDLPSGYPGFAVDTAMTLRDYGFACMDLLTMRTEVITGNQLSLRVNHLLGLREHSAREIKRSDGSVVSLQELRMTRAEWLAAERWVEWDTEICKRTASGTVSRAENNG